MKSIYITVLLAILFILSSGAVFAKFFNGISYVGLKQDSIETVQKTNDLGELMNGKGSASIKNFYVLTDANYSFERILKDTTLQFIEPRKFRPDSIGNFWIKFSIDNTFPYAEKYFVWAFPQMDNTLFHFDHQTKKWATSRAGLNVNTNMRRRGEMPCFIQGNENSVFYIKINIEDIRGMDGSFMPGVIIEKAEVIANSEKIILIICLSTIAVILAFFLYNCYIYFFFKDVTYLYYLLLIGGGVIYILALSKYFNILLPATSFAFKLVKSGFIYYYDSNHLFLQVGILIVMTGFVLFTRAYLQTSILLPRLDKILKASLYVFIVFTVFSGILTISKIFYAEFYTAFYINIFILLIIGLMLFTGVASFRRGNKLAKYFLIANTIPLLLMFSLATYFTIKTHPVLVITFLPSIAIVIQALTFAVALVARMQILKDELYTRKIEVQQEKAKNDKLQEKIAFNHRELASSTLYVYQKNKLLTDLKTQIEQFSEELPKDAKLGMKQIRSTIQSNLLLDDDWEKFKLHFEQVHPDFFENLRHSHQGLTQNEVRLCAYFHINLSTKEIAALLNIDPESVRKAKTRLNKKINLVPA